MMHTKRPDFNSINHPIYLDYAATTPIDPWVSEKMRQTLSLDGVYGNPASPHVFGKSASLAIEDARSAVAALVKTQAENIIWTSGATESNNLAIKGIAESYSRKGKHIITSQTEHRSVLDSCQDLARRGFDITYLQPTSEGLIDPAVLKSFIRSDTILISIMHVNNETGVIQDIEQIGKIAAEKNILFHVDAAQSVGKLPIDLSALPVDLMSFTAHKIYGPKGIGALYLRGGSNIRLNPSLHGGGQEQGLRAGTLPTHQCVGMGEAFRVAEQNQIDEMKKMVFLRERFWQGLKDLPQVFINGHETQSWPGILNIRFENIERKKFISELENLGNLAFSSASACSALRSEPSYVLRAMGFRYELADRSFRFSFGRYTTLEEIDFTVHCLREAYI